MNFTFWKVTCSINGHSYEFLFDSRYAADEYCKLMDGSIRKYSPRTSGTLMFAWNQAYLTKRWLLDKGHDFWHDDPVLDPDYPEFTDDDGDLPF